MPDVFYFGNAIGESGNSKSDAWVTAIDEIAARINTKIAPRVDVTNRYDFNRDGMVSAIDQILARYNMAIGGSSLQLITPLDDQKYAQIMLAASLSSRKDTLQMDGGGVNPGAPNLFGGQIGRSTVRR